MRATRLLLVLLTTAACFATATQANSETSDGWIPLFDGKSLREWKVSENKGSISVKNGQIVCDGPRAHLFYNGPVQTARFKNFELKLEALTKPGANSGVHFHTQYQEKGYPARGYEVQINNTYLGRGNYRERRKTGSLYGVRNMFKSIVRDNEWSNVYISVRGKRIVVKIDDTLIVDYTEPAKPVRQGRRNERVLSNGTFALQCHDSGSKAFFRNILVKPLPDDIPETPAEPTMAPSKYAQFAYLQSRGFPLIDLHAHLKGGLTIEEVLEHSRKTGVCYGVAINCGVGFPITNDEGIHEFLKNMQGQPVFIGMQAEGREWVKMFSKEAISKFDYVFTDAMTFTDHRGKRTRLWMKNEVDVPDKEAFMEMLVKKIVGILDDEPIDVYVNPTYLPAVIAAEYDKLWTQERMQKVIDAAARNNVAVEINAKLRLPKADFIKAAKKAGVKFTFGTNNGGKKILPLDYCLEMIEECKLTPNDMFLPKTATASASEEAASR